MVPQGAGQPGVCFSTDRALPLGHVAAPCDGQNLREHAARDAGADGGRARGCRAVTPQVWSGGVWRRARHLFGTVCDEKYRAGCAQQILISLGYSRELSEALEGSSDGGDGGGSSSGDDGGDGGGAGGEGAGGECAGRRRSRIAVEPEVAEQAGTRQGRGVVQPVAPVDEVQKELYKCIMLRHGDGTLRKEWELWGLGEHLQECLTLATAPAGDTRTSAVLSVERTPGLYNIFIDMLFIGLSDNTRCAAHMQC